MITHLLPHQLDAATATLMAAFDADPIYIYTFPAAGAGLDLETTMGKILDGKW